MKCTVILDKTREEEIIIYAHKTTPLIDEIERMSKNDTAKLVGYLRGEIVKLDMQEIYCFTIDSGKLYAICENEKFLIKAKLYAVEQMLDNSFIKINQRYSPAKACYQAYSLQEVLDILNTLPSSHI